MIRLLHFADVHLGMENYGRIDPDSGLNSRVHDFLRRLDEMIDFARQRDPDLVVFAGDAFKNRQPNPTLQRELAWRVRDLAQMCPVILLVGNHDLPAILQRASTLEIYDTLAVPNVKVGYDFEVFPVLTKHGPVLVATAPYPIRAGLLEERESHGKTLTQIDALVQEKIQVILRDLARQAVAFQPASAPRILIGHFTVSGAILGSERNIMIGSDVSVLLSELADPTWDYVALGHIHKHQNMTAGRSGVPSVVYSGSLERIDFGEAGDPKGFCWVELERGNTRWQFVPVSSRPFVHLLVDVRGQAEPMRIALASIEPARVQDAVVKMTILTDFETEPKLRLSAIQDALREAGANVVAGINKEIERSTRSRIGASPEGLTALELLERFLETKNVSRERIEVLMKRAEELFSEGTEALNP